MEIKEKVPSVFIAILKGWAVGGCIGITLGGGFGIILARLYGNHSTISNAGLLILIAAIGILIGSYYGSVIAYSNFKKYDHFNIPH